MAIFIFKENMKQIISTLLVFSFVGATAKALDSSSVENSPAIQMETTKLIASTTLKLRADQLLNYWLLFNIEKAQAITARTDYSPNSSLGKKIAVQGGTLVAELTALHLVLKGESIVNEMLKDKAIRDYLRSAERLTNEIEKTQSAVDSELSEKIVDTEKAKALVDQVAAKKIEFETLMTTKSEVFASARVSSLSSRLLRHTLRLGFGVAAVIDTLAGMKTINLNITDYDAAISYLRSEIAADQLMIENLTPKLGPDGQSVAPTDDGRI
jgi:prefoldin subunit 5